MKWWSGILVGLSIRATGDDVITKAQAAELLALLGQSAPSQDVGGRPAADR